MTTLRPMPESAYPAYVTAAVAAYAQDNVSAGRWPAAGALERSRDEFASLLPLGLATPQQHLFEIVPHDGGQAVGWLWLALEQQAEHTKAFVYDIEVAPEHRRQGHAKRAFQQLEQVARDLGAHSIGLHVFANNVAAQALYRHLGYTVTGLNLQKSLGHEMGTQVPGAGAEDAR